MAKRRRRRRGLGDSSPFPGATKLNADARAAIKAARRGNCKSALAHLYDASPHIQRSGEATDRDRSDFRTASIIVGKLCTIDRGRGGKYRSGQFQGSRRTPWYVPQRWEVEAFTKDGTWKPIYIARTRKQAKVDATEWKRRTGQKTRIVPGPGHKTRRGF